MRRSSFVSPAQSLFCYKGQMKRANLGYTLIELLIVLVIAAILLTLALPSFTDMIRNNRVSSTTNSFTHLVNFARVEAITKGREVHVGATDASNWANGMVVWIDDGDDIYDESNDEVLRVTGSLNHDQSFVEGNSLTQFTFSPSGITNISAQFLVCDGRTGETGRSITVIRGGSVWAKEQTCT